MLRNTLLFMLCLSLFVVATSACSSPSASEQKVTTTQAMAQHSHADHHHADGPNAPTVRLSVNKDPMSGWNVHIETTNFVWAPEHASRMHVDGEGHAHLYVDGKKLARVYGPFFHMASLENGKHEIRVTLNGNDHAEYVVGDKPVADSVTVVVD